MTADEIFRQALQLLNYPSDEPDLRKKALPLINQIYADLWYINSSELFVPLTSLMQKVQLESNVLSNVMPYGVSMLIAQTEGDADNHALYASLYNQRRPSARSSSDRFEDRMPKVFF